MLDACFVLICRMFWIAYYAKLWVYPVLEVLGWTERLLFLAACWLLMIGCYFVGELYTSILWRECYFHGHCSTFASVLSIIIIVITISHYYCTLCCIFDQ